MCSLVSLENVSGIYFINYVIKAAVISVGDDGLALTLELLEIIYNFASVEGCAVFESWLIDDDVCAFGLDSFHYTLYGTLAEIVRVALHCKSVYAYSYFAFH